MPDKFKINASLDIARAKKTLASQGVVQINSILELDSAELLWDCLDKNTPWGLAYDRGGTSQYISHTEWNSLTASQHQSLDDFFNSSAREGYQYRYFNYPILDAYLQQWPDEVLLLHDFLEFINSPPWMDLAREVTSLPSLIKCDAQATLYSKNCFLHRHSDYKAEEGWRVAYVLSLTKDWRANYGGVLQFLGNEDDIQLGLLPRFNALNLFLVPRWHMVSHVPEFAPIGRYAITGWFRDR